jgi:hypothetical protein
MVAVIEIYFAAVVDRHCWEGEKECFAVAEHSSLIQKDYFDVVER